MEKKFLFIFTELTHYSYNVGLIIILCRVIITLFTNRHSVCKYLKHYIKFIHYIQIKDK